MLHLGIDEQAATALIADAARHLPIGESLGRIRFVGTYGILTDGGVHNIDRNADCLWRIFYISPGLAEYTTWYAGVEESRRIIRHEPE